VIIRERPHPIRVEGFVRALGTRFEADGRQIFLAGANCYYLAFVDEPSQRSVLELARGMGLNTIRSWGFLDAPDAGRSVWFQTWNDTLGRPVLNEGPDGLERLDRAISLAEEYELRLILPLVNYWDDYGGMSQYAQWFGLGDRDRFYADSRTREAYKAYVQALLTRVNTISGRRYCDEPAVLAWELANEPRSPGEGALLLDWADEMSRYIKTLDSNHLVACGDEGFYRKRFRFGNAAYNGSHGVDVEVLLRLPAIDFGTYHLYTAYGGRADPAEFGRRWIRDHVRSGERAGKPVVLEEYGVRAADGESRAAVYTAWLAAVHEYGGAGDLVWGIAGDVGGARYPDYDGFTLYSAADARAVIEHIRR
jgi:mannan endo-1,4-beta-mannosidase